VNATPVPPITKGTKRKGRSTLVRGKKCKIHLDSFPIKQDENDPQPPSLELIEASSSPNLLHSDDDDAPPPFLELDKVASSPNLSVHSDGDAAPQLLLSELIESSSPPTSLHSDDDDAPPPSLAKLNEASPTPTSFHSDGVDVPSLAIDLDHSSLSSTTCSQDNRVAEDDVSQRVQMENDSGACCVECISDSPFVEPLPEWIEFLDASRNRPHRDKQILCKLVMLDAVPVVIESVSIDFESQTFTRYFMSNMYVGGTNPSTFSNKLQLLQLYSEFDNQRHCPGLPDLKYRQVGAMTTEIFSDGTWRSKK
jgi:hypothetical protein